MFKSIFWLLCLALEILTIYHRGHNSGRFHLEFVGQEKGGSMAPQEEPNPLLGKIGSFLIRLLVKLRYRVNIRGLDRLQGDSGFLFLPNHPCHFDPIIMTSHLWDRFQPRPMAIDYCFWTPVMSKILKYVKGFPVPNFHEGFSQIKMRRMDRVLEEVGVSLENGANIVVYPSGGERL